MIGDVDFLGQIDPDCAFSLRIFILLILSDELIVIVLIHDFGLIEWVDCDY
jgi:hypothetical protein